MPIGDLLAQISGKRETASSTSTSAPPRTNLLPAKRKPDHELHGGGSSKAPRRVANTPQKPSQPPLPTRPTSPTSSTPSQLQRTTVGNGVKPNSASPSKPVAVAPRLPKPSTVGRPSSKPATPSKIPKAPPKKGSFAEILARGQRAQAVMGQVGKIQHKKVEKGATKGKEEAKPIEKAQGKGTAGYKGTSKPVPRNGANGVGSLKDAREGAAPRPNAGVAKHVTAEQEEAAAKKVKKAAQATTGYTGTARPKPGNPARKKDAHRGGALLNVPMPRHGSSKRSRFEDDYDEELDDFIEYDDEEEQPGKRYDYASDGSSDMEAGLDELDVEERRADQLARKEDIEEERIEKGLKAAKEERKRRALEAIRAGKRH